MVMKFPLPRLWLLLILGSILLIPGKGYTQQNSRLQISLLTCTPGDELYSIFGHSALRVIDSVSHKDYVFNYGTFNFDDEGFYLKFIRGKLLYYLSIANFEEFQYEYRATNRGITEQVLNLSDNEKNIIRQLLVQNIKEENRYYKYDFFLDNCTTRLRDIILQTKKPAPMLPAVMPANTTFREAIHLYLDKGEKNWSKLGIDILLGSPTDAIMTPAQQQFLPDNLMEALNQSTNVKVVSSKSNLFLSPQSVTDFSWFTPFVFFSLILFLFVALSISKSQSMATLLRGLDGVLFFLVGLLGIILVFMMTATDHSMTKNNYNIFWAWPTHLITSFFIGSQRKPAKWYFFLSAVFTLPLLAVWFFLPQHMSFALLPLVVLLGYRSFCRWKWN